MCTTINSKERLLATKLDSLYKYVGHKKATVDTLGMVEGMIYYCPKFVHKKMKHCMLLVFVTMWLIGWPWGRLGKEKEKGSIYYCVLFVEGR
jgi:hypothetical protein